MMRTKFQSIIGCGLVLCAFVASAIPVDFTLDAFVPEKKGETVKVRANVTGLTSSALDIGPVSAVVATNGYLNVTVSTNVLTSADFSGKTPSVTWSVDGEAVSSVQTAYPAPYALAAACATLVENTNDVITLEGGLTVTETVEADSVTAGSLALKQTDSASSKAELLLKPMAGKSLSLVNCAAEFYSDKAVNYIGDYQEITTKTINGKEGDRGSGAYFAWNSDVITSDEVVYTAGENDEGFLIVDITGSPGSNWRAAKDDDTLYWCDYCCYPVAFVSVVNDETITTHSHRMISEFEKFIADPLDYYFNDRYGFYIYDSTEYYALRFKCKTGSGYSLKEYRDARVNYLLPWMIHSRSAPLSTRLTIPVSPGETYTVKFALAILADTPAGLVVAGKYDDGDMHYAAPDLLRGSTMTVKLGFRKLVKPEVKQ